VRPKDCRVRVDLDAENPFSVNGLKREPMVSMHRVS
jgi:hypothetical protein